MFRSQKFEILWPWACSVLVAAIWWWLGSPFPTAPDGLFGTAATVASVFASFLGVSKAILLSIKSTPTYQALKQKGYTDPLFNYLKSGIFSSVIFAAMSILGFFISKDKIIDGHSLFHAFSALWVLIGALALFAYMRIANILFKLLKVA